MVTQDVLAVNDEKSIIGHALGPDPERQRLHERARGGGARGGGGWVGGWAHCGVIRTKRPVWFTEFVPVGLHCVQKGPKSSLNCRTNRPESPGQQGKA